MSFILGFMMLLFAGFSMQDSVIRGTVTDDQDEPLQGVHVFVEGGTAGTVTDLEGAFTLRVSQTGNVNLNASMIGYSRHTQSLELEAGAEYEVHIRLTSITLRSGDVIVTAGRRSQAAGNAPVSVSTVSAAEIKSRNSLSLDQSLRYVPGVQMAQNQVNVRGSTGFAYGTGSRVLLLVDGVPLMGPDQNDIKFSSLPMTQVERIEIVKGPGSALYGSGALGGVINLITRDFPEIPETRIRGFSGWYEPVSHPEWKQNWDGAETWRPYYGAVFSHARSVGDQFGFWVNGVFRSDDGYLEETTEREFQLYSKLGYRPTPNIHLDLFLGYRYSENRQFLYWNGINDPLRAGRIVFSGEAASGTNHIQSQHYSVLPIFRHIISDRLLYTLRGRFYGIAVKPYDSRGEIRPRDQHTYGMRYGGEAEITWLPNQGGTLIAGGSYDDIVAESEFFIGQDEQPLRNQPEYAVFVQYDHEFSRSLLASAGLRYDAYQIDTRDVATQWSPKLNLAWSPNEALTFRAAYGHGFRVPAVSERFVNNRDFLPLEPNLDLRPEESVGYELGALLVNRLSPLVSLEWDMALFWNEYDNFVEPQFVPALAGFQFINLDEARIRGLETSLTFMIDRGRHEVKLGYTYLDHENKETGRPLTYRSDHQFIAGLQSRLPFAVELGIDYRFYSKPEELDSDFSIFVPDADEYEPIHVVDARISRSVNFWEENISMRISAAVNNVFRYYYVERPAYLAPPRTFEFSLQFDF